MFVALAVYAKLMSVGAEGESAIANNKCPTPNPKISNCSLSHTWGSLCATQTSTKKNNSKIDSTEVPNPNPNFHKVKQQ